MTRTVLITTTLLVGLLALANHFDPLRAGLSAVYYADPDWSASSIVATPVERPSTERLMAAWLGAPPEMFSASWAGSFLAVRNGEYVFSTVSDDGTWVYVDGRLVVDNGGRHGPVAASGAVTLERGAHDILIKYRQDGGDVRLDVLWGSDARSLGPLPNWALTPRSVSYWRFMPSAALRRALTAAALLWVCALCVGAATTVAGPAASLLRRIVTGRDWQSAGMLVLLTSFVLIGLFSVGENSLTYDESDHYRYGVNILAGKSTRFEDSVMPLSALNAVPKRIASFLPGGYLGDALGTLAAARLVTLACSALVAFLVFYWSRSLYGLFPALASLFLYVFDPNIIAHSQLVTTDLYALGTITLAFYTLWRFVHHRTVANGLLCAAALGVSQLAKYTAIALFPLFMVTIGLYDARSIWTSYAADGARVFRTYLRKYVCWGLVTLATSVLIINVGFLFNGTFTRFGSYAFKSDLFQGLQRQLPAFRRVPIPVPYAYLEGLDWVIQLEKTGTSYGDVYLLGELRKGYGFKGYYLVASYLKVPIATQVLTLAAVLLYVISRKRNARFFDDELFLLLPIAFFVVYFNVFDDAQIGIRHYLVIAPLLYVFAGHLFAEAQSFTAVQKSASLILCGCLVISVLSYHPHYLSYFNEVVWNRTHAYKYLADSNVDWGQGAYKLNQYLSANADVIYRPNQPMAGRLVVSVNDLVGIHGNSAEFAWLRERFEPVGTIAYSYLIYDISAEDISRYWRSRR